VLDVVEAIDGPEPAFTCTEIRLRGPAAVQAGVYRVPCSIHAVLDRADAAWRAELGATTLAVVVEQGVTGASPQALVEGAAWLQEVVR
jgi:DNA-binding IscR family transcriptional regulator